LNAQIKIFLHQASDLAAYPGTGQGKDDEYNKKRMGDTVPCGHCAQKGDSEG